jgi:mannose-6-phosphate isomerase
VPQLPIYLFIEVIMESAFSLQPEYRDYVWGGQKLRPGQRTAEAWIVFEGDRIATGDWKGLTMAEAATQHPQELLGSKPLQKTGTRFPLLIKLLDCADWLSVQVHPNDAQAVQMEGAGKFGKTEAWHFLEVEPGSEIISGLKAGTPPAALQQALNHGGLMDLLHHQQVSTGDSLLIRAGMVHALGPGMLLYECQQTSDITYRVFDWNRPASAGRPLHIPQSLAVIDPHLSGQIVPPPALGDGKRQVVVSCDYFTLELIRGMSRSVTVQTKGESFHILTLTEGRARVEGEGWSLPLKRFESAVVPAAAQAYRLEPEGSCQALLAYVA